MAATQICWQERVWQYQDQLLFEPEILIDNTKQINTTNCRMSLIVLIGLCLRTLAGKGRQILVLLCVLTRSGVFVLVFGIGLYFQKLGAF